MLALYWWIVAVTMAGEIRDAVTQSAIPGASISVAGVVTVVSDSSGRFRLDIPEGARVRITCSGYAPLELAARADTNLRILLTPVTRALERVTITAIRGTAAVDRAPITQSMISMGELEERYSGQEMPLLLSQTPALTSYADGGAYSNYTYFRIRGIDQTRVNITLDGIPLNDAEDQGVFFSNFPDFGNSVQSVQVQRGVGTSSLGTAAYAGSVNFESIALANSARRAELQLSRGSFNTTRGSGEWQSSWGGGA